MSAGLLGRPADNHLLPRWGTRSPTVRFAVALLDKGGAPSWSAARTATRARGVTVGDGSTWAGSIDQLAHDALNRGWITVTGHPALTLRGRRIATHYRRLMEDADAPRT